MSLEAEYWKNVNKKKETIEDHGNPPTIEDETVPLGYLESLPVILMCHELKMAVLMIQGGVLRIKWILNLSDHRCTEDSQFYMLRCKVYFRHSHV